MQPSLLAFDNKVNGEDGRGLQMMVMPSCDIAIFWDSPSSWNCHCKSIWSCDITHYGHINYWESSKSNYSLHMGDTLFAWVWMESRHVAFFAAVIALYFYLWWNGLWWHIIKPKYDNCSAKFSSLPKSFALV